MDSKELTIAKQVFSTEIAGLKKIRDNLGTSFLAIITLILNCQGKIILIGMGKSGHVARKIAATMSSLGSCAISLHPGECMHGDLGMIQKQDLIILISYSGESEEIIRIIPNIRMIGSTIIGITSNKNSTVAQKVDVVQIFEDVHEACHLGLAPTTSTTIAMVYGDALAVTVSILKGFDKKDFGLLHPAGSLGKRLTIRAVDLMHAVPTQQILHMDSFLSDALMVMIESGMEIITISDEKEKIIGIIDEKTIKSALISGIDIYSQTVSCYIRKFPIFMDVSAMAIDALTIMNENDLTSIPIVNEERVIGIIKKTDILKVGICQ